MKLLIVDDERHVREAIKLLIQWDNFSFQTVLEAANGQDAMEIISNEKPDIVLTDMLMPLINGVQLLESIQNYDSTIKTIVISGYDDFNYVRHTIKYGGQDYILKPIDEEQLNQAISKAVASREKELQQQSIQQQHSIKLNVIKPLYWNKVFSSIMEQGTISTANEHEIINEFGLSEPIQFVKVAIIPIQNVCYKTIQRFNQNLELLSYSLANICNEFLHKDNVGYAFHNWNAGYDVVLILWKQHDHLPSLIQSINRGIERTFGHHCDFGIGSTESFPKGLKASYKAASMALKTYNLLNPQSRVHSLKDNHLQYEMSLRFEKYQEHIRLALLSEQLYQAKLHVKLWFDELNRLPIITLEQLDYWQQQLLLFEARCLEQELSEVTSSEFSINGSHFYIPFNEEGQLDISMWQHQLIKLIEKYMLLIEKSNKQVSISLEIAEFINKNYSEELSLQTIADCFLLSREYISRKFKQDMNENLSDYIAKIRINHAKQLLANPQLKLVQISEMVGYQDDKYFSKVFKKLVGVSPNQYRKELLINQ